MSSTVTVSQHPSAADDRDLFLQLTLHGLEKVTGSNKTGVGAVVALRSEAHGGTVAATSAGSLIEGTAGVPREAEEDRSEAAIVVVVLLLEARGDLVVNALEVLLGRVDNLGGGSRGGTVGRVVPVAEGTGGGGGATEKEALAVALEVDLLGGVGAATLLTEGLTGGGREGVADGGPGGQAVEGACGRSHLGFRVSSEVQKLKFDKEVWKAGAVRGGPWGHTLKMCAKRE